MNKQRPENSSTYHSCSPESPSYFSPPSSLLVFVSYRIIEGDEVHVHIIIPEAESKETLIMHVPSVFCLCIV